MNEEQQLLVIKLNVVLVSSKIKIKNKNNQQPQSVRICAYECLIFVDIL